MTAKTVARPPLTVEQQCDHMAVHHISFNLCSRQDAVYYLTNSTYYFKLKAFNNNFRKDADGNYYNVDFAHVQDIAAIDFHLRSLILALTGDIEHSLRVRFNNLMSEYDVDPYAILGVYEKRQREFYESRHESFNLNKQFQRSIYTQDMLDKYMPTQPIWLFWETCTLNSLIQCYLAFLEENRIHDRITPFLFGVRLLRNAASHHNCLLIPSDNRPKKSRTMEKMLSMLLEDLDEEDFVVAKTHIMSDMLLHDFTCVLLTYINLIHSKKLRAERLHLIEQLYNRLGRNECWYADESVQYKPIFLLKVRILRNLLASVLRFYEKADKEQYSTGMIRLTAQPKKVYRKKS